VRPACAMEGSDASAVGEFFVKLLWHVSLRGLDASSWIISELRSPIRGTRPPEASKLVAPSQPMCVAIILVVKGNYLLKCCLSIPVHLSKPGKVLKERSTIERTGQKLVAMRREGVNCR